MAQLFKTQQEWRQDTALIRPGVFCYELPGITINEVLFYRFKVGASSPQRYINLPYAPNLAPAASVVAPTAVTGPGTSTAGNIPTWADGTGSTLTPGIPQSTFATAAQGLLADTAVQPGDDLTTLGSGSQPAGRISQSDGAGGVTWAAAPSGSGTVTSVSVVTANGVSGSVANPTTTPDITLTLGAITPSSVNSVVLTGSSTPTLAVTGTSAISGTNTGDQDLSGYALKADPLSQFASTTSAQLAGVISDETGTGALVFANSPVLVTPDLGTPSTLVGTNITGTASGLTAGNVTTNANLTGPVTSVGNATSISFGQTVQMEPYLAGSQSNNTLSLAVAADTEIDLTSTGTWVATYNISYTAPLTTTGSLFTVNTGGVLAVSNISGCCLYTTLTGDANNSLIGAFAGGLPVASSRVASPSLNGAIINVTLVVTTPGPLHLEWRSEVNLSAIVITNVSGFAVKTGY